MRGTSKCFKCDLFCLLFLSFYVIVLRCIDPQDDGMHKKLLQKVYGQGKRT